MGTKDVNTTLRLDRTKQMMLEVSDRAGEGPRMLAQAAATIMIEI